MSIEGTSRLKIQRKGHQSALKRNDVYRKKAASFLLDLKRKVKTNSIPLTIVCFVSSLIDVLQTPEGSERFFHPCHELFVGINMSENSN